MFTDYFVTHLHNDKLSNAFALDGMVRRSQGVLRCASSVVPGRHRL
jgi:hypothetical protein